MSNVNLSLYVKTSQEKTYSENKANLNKVARDAFRAELERLNGDKE